MDSIYLPAPRRIKVIYYLAAVMKLSIQGNNLVKLSLAILTLAAVLSCSDLGFNRPSKDAYPVRGIDVSHHQGNIDWDKASKDEISFVYIKATEGETFTDSLYRYNIKNAKHVGLRTGAYHFYLASKDPLKQAVNFITVVQPENISLPPVVDIEFPAELNTDKSKEQVVKEISICLERIRDFYKRTPVIYTDYDTYNNYLKPGFKEYGIWIRDIHDTPEFSDGRGWTFWQYSNKGLIKGIDGLVDMNVFNGSKALFDSIYVITNKESPHILN